VNAQPAVGDVLSVGFAHAMISADHFSVCALNAAIAA